MRPHPFLAAAFAACALAAVLAACSDDQPAATEPTEESMPTPVASPAPQPAEPVEPVEVVVDYVETQLLDNAVLRGQPQRQPSEAVVEGAVEQARAALERYLTAQFVAPQTRFTSAGYEALLAEGAAADLAPEQRQGLGELDVDLDLSADAPVTAQAVVLTDGDDLLSVTLVFEAAFARDGSAEPVSQSGMLLFPAQEGDSWRAEDADLTVELPEATTR